MHKNILLFLLLALAIVGTTACDQGSYDDYEEFVGGGDFGDDDSGDDDWGDDDDDNGSGNEAGGEGELTLYTVDGDEIAFERDYTVDGSLLDYQADKTRHREMWDFVVRLLPPSARKNIVEFEVFYGANDLLGYVYPINDDDLSRWKFALAIDAAGDLTTIDFSELFTLVTIHEYAHILSLNNEQVDGATGPRDCDTYHTGEGCSFGDSYVNRFVELGWTEIIARGEHQGDPYELYESRPTEFVSDYAATNPGEDIAESFSFFVAEGARRTGTTLADQKVNLFYDYPELVEMRRVIRESGNGPVGRAMSLGTHPGFGGKRVGHGHGAHVGHGH